MSLHVLYLIDSLSRSGAEQALAAMAPHWVGAGVRLDVAYFHERDGLEDELRAAGAELLPLGAEGGRREWARRATAVVRQRRPDLIHATLFESDLASRVAGPVNRVPVVSSLVNMSYGPEQRAGTSTSHRIKLRLAQAIDSASARMVRRFHAITKEVGRVMGRRLLIPADKIDVVPRGRDPDKLGTRHPARRAAARAMLGIGDDTRLVFAGARQEHQKGLDVLLRAFPRVAAAAEDVRLVIAGREGNQTPLLRRIVAENRMDVTFLGMRSDIADLLCAADVWVEPSRWEGGPGAMLEAMALEAPIVASDLAVYEGAVESGVSALLVPPDRPDLLADAILAVLADPAAAAARAASAKQMFDRSFTVGGVAAQLIDFYRRALEGPDGNSR